MSERRRYFRIDDEFQVRFAPSNGGPRAAVEAPAEARELGQALARLRQKLPEAAEAIEMIARRVAVLEQHGDADGSSADFLPAAMVQGTNISGCGLAFYSRVPLKSGQLLDLELYLDAGAVHLRAAGRVVSCERLKTGDPGGLVRVDFVEIAPEDEETLVQYVLRRQLRQLRKSRAGQDEQAAHRR